MIRPTPTDDNDERDRRMDQSITEMARTPGSGIVMCHEQGKMAVYLSEDKTCIVEHPPHGSIRRTTLEECDRWYVTDPRSGSTLLVEADAQGTPRWVAWTRWHGSMPVDEVEETATAALEVLAAEPGDE